MRKKIDGKVKDSSRCELGNKKRYVRPELVKKEKLALLTGSGAPRSP